MGNVPYPRARLNRLPLWSALFLLNYISPIENCQQKGTAQQPSLTYYFLPFTSYLFDVPVLAEHSLNLKGKSKEVDEALCVVLVVYIVGVKGCHFFTVK